MGVSAVRPSAPPPAPKVSHHEPAQSRARETHAPKVQLVKTPAVAKSHDATRGRHVDTHA